MSDDLTNYTEEELEELEEKLLEEDEKEREEIMPVSGKSVFEIQKAMNQPKKKDDGDK